MKCQKNTKRQIKNYQKSWFLNVKQKIQRWPELTFLTKC